jgi:MFS family permease
MGMSARATNPRRTLALLCLASLGWAFSFGLGAPLAALWLRDAGCSARVIGLNTSIYYLGVALTSVFVPRLMGWGGRTCVVAGMALDAAVTALFPWGTGPAGWFLLRLLGGAGTALSLIPLETLVNRNAPPDRRASDFGLYAFAVALGVGLGSLVGLPLYPLAPRPAFVLGGLVTLFAAALAAWGLAPGRGPAEEAVFDADTAEAGPLSVRAHMLSFGTAWAQGFLEGGMLTFLSLYLLTLGYTEVAVSWLLGGLFLGVILFQVPVAWLADWLGRTRVLLACHLVLLAGLACVPSCTGPLGLSFWLFLMGACCGAQYPLGLALLGERVAGTALARANAWYLASNCAGSLSGPVLIGLAIDRLGQRAQFAAAAAALVLVLAAWAACRRENTPHAKPPRRKELPGRTVAASF